MGHEYESLRYVLTSRNSSPKLLMVDRDDTLIADKGGYLFKSSDLQVMPGVEEGLSFAKSRGYAVAIITNQSGIGRDYFSKEEMEEFHRCMLNMICKDNDSVQLIMVCPHAPNIENTSLCNCRKPNPGMLIEAIDFFNADPQTTIMIGDKETDLLAARRAGVQGINVRDYANFFECCVSNL